jgi:nitric-oxide synthase, bacterial
VISDYTPSTLQKESADFLYQYGNEKKINSVDIQARIEQIHEEIRARNSYHLTSDELAFGAQLAWRNSNRCIGRLFWKNLRVFDCRHVTTPDEMFNRLCDHISFASNEGAIRPAITVFAAASGPGQEDHESEHANRSSIRILNHQLFRYAGYRQSDGSVIGDPMNLEFTERCIQLGWTPPPAEQTDPRFQVLPLVIESADGTIHWYEWPRGLVMEVPIVHRDYPTLSDLNLKWYAVPIISDMILEIGGLHFPTAPFNGWYMGTEIGARNLADESRYNLLPQVAHTIGLDTRKNRTLWKDQALVVLNQAVLESFEAAGVKIVDHHTASEQFMQFESNELKQNRTVHGDWSWLVPPMSGSATHVFHKEYHPQQVSPNYLYPQKKQTKQL